MARQKTSPPAIAYAALVAVIIQWITLISFLLLDFRFAEQFKPISYWATNPNTQPLFTWGFALSAILVWTFIALWARKFLKISLVLFSISMICFVAIATIPFRPEDIQNLVQHENITALFAFAYILGILDVARRNPDKQLRFISLVCGVVGLIFGFITWRTDSSKYNTIILYEIICTFIAHYWLLWISRYTLKKSQLS